MRVLVTGAGGFLGGHLARRLAEEGFDVLATSRASPIEPPVQPAAARRFSTLTADLASSTLPSGIDAVVHTAATSPWPGIGVDRMLHDNVVATQAMVRHALAARSAVFIFCSSVSAFGRIQAPVLSEAEPAVAPDAYGLTKLLGESLLAEVADALPSLSLRLPAVIGRGSKRNWPSECLRKLKADAPLEFFNPQAPFNNVVHESDVAQLVRTAVSAHRRGAETLLLGSVGRITIADAVRILAEETRSRSAITAVARDRPAFLLDSGKAARLFGFAPMDVEAALRRFARENA